MAPESSQPNMDIKFKKINVEDWERIKSLEEGAASDMFAPCDGEEGYKNYIRESQVFTILKDNKAIGTISYKNQEDGSVLINGLTILPDYRGHGIAKMAMQLMIEKIGNKKLCLYVHPHNTAALMIYLHLGFQIMEWKENVFGNNQPRLYLQKPLT